MGVQKYKFYAIQCVDHHAFYVSDLLGMLDVLDSDEVIEFKTYEEALELLGKLPKYKVKHYRIVEVLEFRRITVCKGW